MAAAWKGGTAPARTATTEESNDGKHDDHVGVSYGTTQPLPGVIVRVDDLPQNKKKLMNNCSSIEQKIASLLKTLARLQAALSARVRRSVELRREHTGVSRRSCRAVAWVRLTGSCPISRIPEACSRQYQAELAACMQSQAAGG